MTCAEGLHYSAFHYDSGGNTFPLVSAIALLAQLA